MHGESVILRPLRPADMPARAKWHADPELSALMGASSEDETSENDVGDLVQQHRQWLKRRQNSGTRPYAIEADGRYIGDIDFGIYPEQKKADLTVCIGDRSQWGKGYGTAAVELMITEIFRDEGIDYIEVDVAPCNDRALRFWNKLGFSGCRLDDSGTRYLRRHRPSGPAT